MTLSIRYKAPGRHAIRVALAASLMATTALTLHAQEAGQAESGDRLGDLVGDAPDVPAAKTTPEQGDQSVRARTTSIPTPANKNPAPGDANPFAKSMAEMFKQGPGATPPHPGGQPPALMPSALAPQTGLAGPGMPAATQRGVVARRPAAPAPRSAALDDGADRSGSGLGAMLPNAIPGAPPVGADPGGPPPGFEAMPAQTLRKSKSAIDTSDIDGNDQATSEDVVRYARRQRILEARHKAAKTALDLMKAEAEMAKAEEDAVADLRQANAAAHPQVNALQQALQAPPPMPVKAIEPPKPPEAPQADVSKRFSTLSITGPQDRLQAILHVKNFGDLTVHPGDKLPADYRVVAVEARGVSVRKGNDHAVMVPFVQ